MQNSPLKEIILWGRSCNKKGMALLAALFIVAFPSFAQEQKKLNIQAENVPVSAVMQQIEQQSGHTFFYNNEVNVNQLVTVSVKDADLRTALNATFRGTGIAWSINNTSIILSKEKAAAGTQHGDELTGVILDAAGLPVIGAAVMVNGSSTRVAITDIDGRFSLPWSDDLADANLEISLLGYEPLTVPVNGQSTMNLVMQEDIRLIESSVVTALGIKKSERAVTYAVQPLDDDVFDTRDANLVNSLSGKLAGVQVTSTSAGAGAETKVVMRGQKSISNSNNALYVLDGIPLPTLSMTSPGDSYSIYNGSSVTGDGISNFNPDDIGSMSALVGPSAAALYGYKAANGVLMLTTRTGEEGISVSYSTNTTFSSPLMLPNLQSEYGAKEANYASWGNKLNTAQSWSVKDFFQTGYNTQHSISLSVGEENSSTYVSLGYNGAEGIIPNNEYTRYNFTANHTRDFLEDKLHLSLLGMYMKVSEQNMLSGGQYYNPLIPLYLMSPSDDLGKYAVYERYDASRNFPVQYWDWGSMNLQAQNPFWIINRNMFNTDKNRFLTGASLSWDIAEWVDVSARGRLDYNNSLQQQKNYASTSGLYAGEFGRYFHNQGTTMQSYFDFLVNFHHNFADNLVSLTGTIGASIEDYNYKATYVAGDLLGVANLFTFSNMETSKGFYKTTYRDQTQSVFATAQVGYDNMLFLDATFRTDWCSQLVNTESLPLVYPSVGLTAILTDIFNIESGWLDYWKVRGSYAEVGNPVMRFITSPTYPVTSGAPAERTYGTSDDFRPERTRSFEAGTDLRLFGGLVNVAATYYHSMTFDQVFTPEMPASFAYSTYYVNSGRVDNKGIELNLGLDVDLGPVNWKSNVIYSRNINTIKEMLSATINGQEFTSDQLSVGGTTGVQMWLTKGRSIGDLYVRGLKTDEHGMISVGQGTGLVEAAEVDGTTNTLIYAGNVNPSWTGSWTNSFSWNGLRLSFQFNARVGGVGVSLTEAILDTYGMSERTAEARNEGGVLVNGVRIPKVQEYYETIGGNGTEALGAYYTYSMTNIRLSDLTIGYDIPVQKWQKVIKGLNVSLVGKNLALLYCKAPFDPELASGAGNYSTGIDYFSMPSTRNLGFSVKITF